MVFSSSIFLFCFLPTLTLLYFIVGKKANNYVLLIFSLIFYAWGEPNFLFVMIGLVFTDYIAAMLLDMVNSHEQLVLKRIILITTIVVNLGILIFFKYTMFLVSNFNRITGFSYTIPKIVLPIGISFFTFQAMSYVIDIYRNEVKVQKNPFHLLLYVSLFPQLIAGPIVRYKTVADEIYERQSSLDDICYGLERFIIGLAKKLIIANKTGELADLIYNGSYVSTPTMWLAAIAYTLHIFFDFSAYSDMAIGLGRIFGFHFNENFNYPYISKSITEFWRRWHISLSTWFRDYIYIPLGGNRKGVKRQIINMFVVWLLTGIWHGAAWNFILWGLYYFLLLLFEKVWLLKKMERWPASLQHGYLLVAVVIGWVLFRLESLPQCLSYIKILFIPVWDQVTMDLMVMYLYKYGFYLLLGILFSAPILDMEHIKSYFITKKYNLTIFYLTKYIVMLILFGVSVLYLVNSTYNPFIYFRF